MAADEWEVEEWDGQRWSRHFELRADTVARLAPEDRALWDAMGSAAPLFTTWPRPGTANELAAFRVISRWLGKRPMPWQEWCIRVESEKRADDPRRYRYYDTLTTVPRQSGKTMKEWLKLLTRAFLYKRRHAAYTAQTGQKATERWSKDLVEDLIGAGKVSKMVKHRRSQGTESTRVLRTNSVLQPFPPTAEWLHGSHPDDVGLDEIFKLTMAQGHDLLGAAVPSQSTRPAKQLSQCSTAGHRGSTFMREQVLVGRASTFRDDAPGCYFEWGLPGHLDPYDESLWEFHPALGHTISLEDMRMACRKLPRHEWERAYCNRWVVIEESFFDDLSVWDRLATDLQPPSWDRVALGWQIDAARYRCAVVAAWWLPDGRAAVKTVLCHTDPAVFYTQLVDLALPAQGPKPLAVLADDGGENRAVLDALGRVVEASEAVKGRDFTAASSAFAAAVKDGRLAHTGDDADLNEAVATAQPKKVGESWAWSHQSHPALLAATSALRGLETAPPPVADPDFRFGS